MARPKKEAVQASTTEYVPDSETQDEPKVEIIADSEPKTSKNDVKSGDEGIAELKRKYEESELGRLKAERERNEAVQRAYRADSAKDEADRLFIESTMNQTKSNASILEGHLANAMAGGDAAQIAKIIRDIAANENVLATLKNGEQSLREKPKAPPVPLDPVEAFASQLSHRSAAWVRAHPEYATNDKLTRKMIAAHNMALAEGYSADTDAYFESVEDALKINRRAPARDDDWGGEQYSDASRGQGGRQVAPSAIPVSRDVSPSGRNTRVVRLTKEEAEIASMTGQTERQYYENKMRIEHERMN